MEFKNKPVKDWTLAEAKEYCEEHYGGETFCLGKGCALNNARSCTGCFRDMELNNLPKFSQDEITLCRLVKKTFPWAKYIYLDDFGYIRFTEEQPILEEGQFWILPTSRGKTLPADFFPHIVSFESYVIDDIIASNDTKS